MPRKGKLAKRCGYIDFCYISEAQDCFGYKTDCPLYIVSNDEEIPESRYHKAMDELINRAKMKHSGSNLRPK